MFSDGASAPPSSMDFLNFAHPACGLLVPDWLSSQAGRELTNQEWVRKLSLWVKNASFGEKAEKLWETLSGNGKERVFVVCGWLWHENDKFYILMALLFSIHTIKLVDQVERTWSFNYHSDVTEPQKLVSNGGLWEYFLSLTQIGFYKKTSMAWTQPIFFEDSPEPRNSLVTYSWVVRTRCFWFGVNPLLHVRSTWSTNPIAKLQVPFQCLDSILTDLSIPWKPGAEHAMKSSISELRWS